MAVAFHTHTFEIPTASRTETEAAAISDKVLVPSSVGTAAAKDIEYFADAAQGTKADAAMPTATYDPDGVGADAFDSANQKFAAAKGATYIRSLESKGRDAISPEDFRAVGGADDYATIMEGLDYLKGQNGGTMRFPDDGREYVLTATISTDLFTGSTSRSNVKLDGRKCYLKPNDDSIGSVIDVNGGLVEICGFNFDGSAAPSVSAVRNMSPEASNTIQASVRENYFVGFANALHSEADSYQFVANTVINPSVAGVYSANRGMNAVISRNYIYPFAAGAHGIVLDRTDWQPEGVTVSENVVFATGAGGKSFKLLSGLSIHLRDNIFDQSHGVVIDGSVNPVADVLMSGNWFGHHSTYDGTDPLLDIIEAVEVRSINDTIASPFGLLRVDAASQNCIFASSRFRMTADTSVGVDNSSSTTQLIAPIFNRQSGVTLNTDIDANSVAMLVMGGRMSNPPVTVDDAKVIYIGVIGKNYGTTTADLTSYFGPGTASAPSITFREDPNTGVYRHAADVLGLAAGGATAARFDANANAILGPGALTTTATEGFLHIPAMSGAPTGTPTTFTNRIPLCYDRTNNRLYAYVAGTWRSTNLA